MKRLLLFFLFAPLLLWAKPEIIKPKVKTPTSFAIVVDKQSYDRVKSLRPMQPLPMAFFYQHKASLRFPGSHPDSPIHPPEYK